MKTTTQTNRETLHHLFTERFGDHYIPENAEDETEYYNYEKFDQECTEVWQNEDVLQDKFPAAEDLVEFVILNIDWQFPSTFTLDLTQMD